MTFGSVRDSFTGSDKWKLIYIALRCSCGVRRFGSERRGSSARAFQTHSAQWCPYSIIAHSVIA